MHKARPNEPMVASRIHRTERAWADAREPALQFMWNTTTDLEVEGGGLADHRGEVAAEVRILRCTRRGSQLCCGALGHTDVPGLCAMKLTRRRFGVPRRPLPDTEGVGDFEPQAPFEKIRHTASSGEDRRQTDLIGHEGRRIHGRLLSCWAAGPCRAS